MRNFTVGLMVSVSVVALLAGCGHKKEEASSLPAEQVLAGNAILASQSTSSSAAIMPVGTTAVIPVNQSGLVNSEPVVSEGSGMQVASPSTDKPSGKDIQTALKNAGFYHGTIDGDLGAKSKKAIKMFQEKNGLTPDGKVGPKTWKKLSTYLNQDSGLSANPAEGTD